MNRAVRRHRLRGRVAAGSVLVAIGLLFPAAAQAVPIESFSLTPSSTQAGGHPDLNVRFIVGNVFKPVFLNSSCDCENPRNTDVHSPAGFIGNPHAAPRCNVADFIADTCPVDSQVGISKAGVNGVNDNELGLQFYAPVFNLVPPPGEAGLLGFKTYGFDTPIFEVFSARTGGDYGLDADVTGITSTFPLRSFEQVLWGVPADPSHDELRFPFGEPPCTPRIEGYESPFVKACQTPFNVHSNSPLTPFLQNPTTCGVPLTTSLDVLSYDHATSHADSPFPPTTGCNLLTFNPSLSAQPTTDQTDSPSGLDVDLSVPQLQSPSTPAPSEIRATTVTLPPGFTINPNAADGKTSCTDAEAKFGTTEEAQCPEFAKIGTLEVHSPVLPGVLPGAVYIGEPKPGERYRLVLTFDGFGTHVKLPGTVHLDPQTGQIVAEFENLPQFPFEDFNLHFFGSERGALATPTQCGTYPVKTTFTPWDSALSDQTSTQFFTLDSGPGGAPCPGATRPFNPRFSASSVSNAAGAHTPFLLNLTRPDGDQNLTGLTVTTPPGFSATLAGVPYCSDAALSAAAGSGYSGAAELASPSCPAASQIGTAIAGSGAGNHPVYLPGRVYLAGPYKGAPLSLAVITPAVSGPYDLGNVVVRAALEVDPTTAQVTTVSDPLPQILQGVPIRLRSVIVNLDRPGFALNPTNCDPLSVNAQVSGDQGAQANLTSHFQVANCANLNFAPKLAMRFSGATKRAGNPGLTAVLTAKPGEANIARAAVTLPHSEFIDNAHIQDPCTRVQFAAHQCPPGSVIGFARAETPLLGKPLEGPVYLRSSTHKLPDLVAALNGQIEVDLDGHIDTVYKKLPNGEKVPGIRTTFETVPDAPVSKFTLSLNGGKTGLLQNSENLCKASLATVVQITGQNGKTADRNPLIQTSCGAKARHKRHLQRARTVR